MSLPQHLTFGEGGTVSINLLEQPTAANVSIVQGDGTTVVSGLAATVSTINTTLTNAATRGEFAINVDGTTGIAVGSVMHITDDPEEVLVSKVVAPEVTLRRPLLRDHLSASAVQGTQVSAVVNAQLSNALWWDGHCEWLVDGVKYFTAVECTKYPIDRLATVQDIEDIEPSFYHLADEELDVDRLLDLALTHVLKRIAAKSPDMRVKVFPGSTEFRHVTALAALKLFFMRQRGEDAATLYERYTTVLRGEIDSLVGVIPRDADQDGVIEPSDKISMRSVRLWRGG